jgi:hypothetical protein
VIEDPDTLHDEEESLLTEAKKLDGRDASIQTGFGPDPALHPEAYKDVSVIVTSPSEEAAVQIRRSAWQRRVDARAMEERITARCGDQFCMKKAAVQAEVSYVKEWRDYLTRTIKFLDSITGFTIVKSSDFLEMQRLDLEYQWYRRQYEKLTGYKATRHLTVTPPAAPGLPWGWILGLATLATGAYFLGPIVVAVIGARTATKAAATAAVAA